MPGAESSGRRGILVLGVVVVAVVLTVLFGYVVLKEIRTFIVSDHRTFFVASDGDDQADGRSPDRAWRSLARASSQRLQPGDTVRLEGGARFAGSLVLGHDDAGDPSNPVLITSYGDGRAVIEPDGATGLLVHNTSGVAVRDLVVTGSDTTTEFDGIGAYNDMGTGQRLANIEISGVEVSGFKSGITVGGGDQSMGFRDVRIHDSRVHHNRFAGLVVYGRPFDEDDPTYANENVTVSGVSAEANLGDATMTVNSGSGIILGSVREGRIVRSVARGNGAASAAPEGPVGIWTYDSTGVVIEHNLAFGNRTRHADGGGFGLDQNVSDSTLQYNLSYNNDGAGYLVFSHSESRVHTRNIVRFNISVNDSRNGSYFGGITVLGGLKGQDAPGGVSDARIYHNTVVMGGGALQVSPAVRIGGSLRGVSLWNNIFASDNGGPVLLAVDASTAGVEFRGNNYSTTGSLRFHWNGSDFPSLDDWRAGTGKELDVGGPTGTDRDPGLANPGMPVQVVSADRIRDAAGFLPRPDSPMIGAGLNLEAIAGIDPGERDYFGTPLDPIRYDIGAGHAAAPPEEPMVSNEAGG